MSGWEIEFGKDWDVPAEFNAFVEEGALEDASWHNDVLPRFIVACPRNSDVEIEIHVNHVNPSQREFEGSKRFGIVIVQDENHMPLYEGDDLAYVVRFVREAENANRPR
jgi:hypothetical protein